MSELAIHLAGVSKHYPFFDLHGVDLELRDGQIMGLIGPNGAGKSTLIRILMGLVGHTRGTVRVLGHDIPAAQALAKRDIGFVSDDMRLYGHATLDWHLGFVESIYPTWDGAYAATLLERFNLEPAQRIGRLSHGERVKATLLLALARRPRLLVLDEPTTGLDPVARHELLAELMDAMIDDRRAILFSSHQTQDVEQISDQITFLDRGRIIASEDKESLLERWRRLHLEVPERLTQLVPGLLSIQREGRLAVAVTADYSASLCAALAQQGIEIRSVQRLTLEEIFVASVMHNREEDKRCNGRSSGS